VETVPHAAVSINPQFQRIIQDFSGRFPCERICCALVAGARIIIRARAGEALEDWPEILKIISRGRRGNETLHHARDHESVLSWKALPDGEKMLMVATWKEQEAYKATFRTFARVTMFNTPAWFQFSNVFTLQMRQHRLILNR